MVRVMFTPLAIVHWLGHALRMAVLRMAFTQYHSPSLGTLTHRYAGEQGARLRAM